MHHVKRTALVAALAGALCLGGPAAANPAPGPAPEFDDMTTLYALGYALASRANGLELGDEELAAVQRGVADAMQGRAPEVALRDIGPAIQPLVERKIAEATEARRARSAAYVGERAATEGAVTTASGAIYLESKAGEGASPGPSDTVRIQYHGTLPDGTVFDSTRGGDPARFPVNQVIPCFSEGVQQMKVGGTATLVCPSDTAYGDVGSAPFIRPAQAIVFDVELVEVVDDTPPAAETPEPPAPTP